MTKTQQTQNESLESLLPADELDSVESSAKHALNYISQIFSNIHSLRYSGIEHAVSEDKVNKIIINKINTTYFTTNLTKSGQVVNAFEVLGRALYFEKILLGLQKLRNAYKNPTTGETGNGLVVSVIDKQINNLQNCLTMKYLED